MPIRRDLDDVTRFQRRHGRHPGIRRFGHVRLDPGLRVIRHKIGLYIMVHKAMVVQNPCLLQLWDQLSRRRPRRRCVAQRLLAVAEFGQDVDAPVEHGLLLFRAQLRDVLVRVAVETDLMACIADFGQLFGERLDAVGGREEGGFDVVLGVQLEEAVDADCCAIYASRDVRWVLWRSVTGVDPVRYCVYVDWVMSVPVWHPTLLYTLSNVLPYPTSTLFLPIILF